MITLQLRTPAEVDAVLMALQRLRRCDMQPNVNGQANGCLAVRLAERLAVSIGADDPDYEDAVRRWFPLPSVPRESRPAAVFDKVAVQVTRWSGV